MAKTVSVWFALAVMACSLAAILAEESSGESKEFVLTLDQSNFADTVSKHDFIVVEFYAPCIWRFGDPFSSFSKFGCRGFSSWVVSRGTNAGKRGVKLEWAIPRDTSDRVCASNADIVNATAVEAGVRCSCRVGFVGDEFANGTGCFKSCIKEGQEAFPSFVVPSSFLVLKSSVLTMATFQARDTNLTFK